MFIKKYNSLVLYNTVLRHVLLVSTAIQFLHIYQFMKESPVYSLLSHPIVFSIGFRSVFVILTFQSVWDYCFVGLDLCFGVSLCFSQLFLEPQHQVKKSIPIASCCQHHVSCSFRDKLSCFCATHTIWNYVQKVWTRVTLFRLLHIVTYRLNTYRLTTFRNIPAPPFSVSRRAPDSLPDQF